MPDVIGTCCQLSREKRGVTENQDRETKGRGPGIGAADMAKAYFAAVGEEEKL
jgi:hypothetical protein